MISGFHRNVPEIYALRGCYAAYSGNCLPTFLGNLTVPSSRVKKSKINFSGPIFKKSNIVFLLFLEPLKWGRQFVLKRQQGIAIVHCVTFQKSLTILPVEALKLYSLVFIFK